MFAISLEASHSMGLGHLYRMLNFASYLKSIGKKFVFIINSNNESEMILKAQKIDFEVVSLNDFSSNWESKLVEKYNVDYWINDRLDTDQRHSNNVKLSDIKLITFDDLGSGAKYCDLNVCGLFFNNINIEGKRVLKDISYLILNSEIDFNQRRRNKVSNILVTLGGSDTYGITIKVIELLKRNNITATIHVGPSFKNFKALNETLSNEYQLLRNPPSLIKEFLKYDLAITAGGITPFEANATGLPCLIIASENFEIANAKFLDKLGCSKFIGHFNEINESFFKEIKSIDIETMSDIGMRNIKTGAAKKIYNSIIRL